ncbi:ribonuclease HII [Candidatus Saccharibacteria bacterium]|nr:ribonuclease HII [Candidatus Saccharibacteria bacterium]
MLTLGIDEVGRGAWAGPLVVGAVIFDSERVPAGLADSKKLSKKQREVLVLEIKKSAIAVGVGWVAATKVDELGLSGALKLAARQATKQIPRQIFDQLDQIIIDGTANLLATPENPAKTTAGTVPAKNILARTELAMVSKITTLPKADAKIAAVSAAAIVAKVFRDDYMAQLGRVFPRHGFEQHVGYGTKLHQECLSAYGVTPVHRRSFAPIAALDKFSVASSVLAKTAGTVPAKKVEQTAGRIAENIAVEHLEKLGHTITAQNWKTKFCEIDIISEHKKTLYFTEVKYRENARHGDGLAAITPKKLRQMRFAAEFYLQKNAALTENFDIKLAAISLSKIPPKVDNFINNID